MRRSRWSRFSPAMPKADADIKGFLYPRMYRHARVMRIMGEAEGVLRDLTRISRTSRPICRPNGREGHRSARRGRAARAASPTTSPA